MKVSDFIQKNEKKMTRLNRLGYVNSSVILQFRIYQDFKRLSSSMPKMQRYSDVAEKFKVSEKTVRDSIRKMEKLI